jgi:GT2 family glycosyltransferase
VDLGPVRVGSIDTLRECSIGVVVRDRVSVVPGCLDSLREQGLDTHRTIAIVGGAHRAAGAEWPARFPWVEFVFDAAPLTAGRSRNMVLDRVDTTLAALLDADVTGEPGWLERCCERLVSSGAAIVVPVIVYPEGMIHAAGNMEYQNHVAGVSYLHKEHRYYGMPYASGCDLPAVEVDYAESHCFVCDVSAIKDAGGFDEELVEFGEVDTGRRVRASGRAVWAEPAAVVHTNQDALIEVDDVPVFSARWDPQAIERSRQHFLDVWGVDVGEEGGFQEFVRNYNSRLGPLPRRYVRPWALKVDRKVHGLTIRVRRLAKKTGRAVRPVIGSQ